MTPFLLSLNAMMEPIGPLGPTPYFVARRVQPPSPAEEAGFQTTLHIVQTHFQTRHALPGSRHTQLFLSSVTSSLFPKRIVMIPQSRVIGPYRRLLHARKAVHP